MNNSAMPNLPGFGAIAESMEMVRKMWGVTGSPGFSFPGMTAPSLSVEEIDKQIADLKAVEAWLTLNMNMLRGTIQALEVQSATISALKSMGEAFKNAGKATAAASKSETGFSFPFAYPAQPQASAAPSSQQADEPQAFGPAMSASLADPAAWWNMLQSQFKQAVTAATAPASAHGPDGDTQAGASENSADSISQKHDTAQPAESEAAASPQSAASASAPSTATEATENLEGSETGDAASPSLATAAKRTVKAAAKSPPLSSS